MFGPPALWVVVALQVSAAAIPSAPAVPSVALVSQAIDWQPVPGVDDGRERAVLAGQPEAGGTWTYRLRVPNPVRVEPHTHPVDEYITVLEGRWSLGIGPRFEADRLTAFPSGSFVVIPAGTPHFIQVDTPGTVIQSSGSGVFATHPVNQP